jgi:hypothetical protein
VGCRISVAMASGVATHGPQTPHFPVVFVLGVAHCGSTLLGRLLGMHPEVVCVGELMRVDEAVGRGLPCTCGVPVGECAFWRERLPGLRADTALDYRRFEVDTYRRLAAGCGKRVAVDLSKTRIWRRTRWWRDRGEGYVFLVRDSRGVLASALRERKDLDGLLRKHVKWMRRLSRLAARKGRRALTVFYEDLCREPETELRRVCTFLGLDFSADMLQPAAREQHLVHSSASRYSRTSAEIKLDERWRRELTAEQIARIEAAMARLEVFRDRLSESSRA